MASALLAATEINAEIFVLFTVDTECRSAGSPDEDVWGKLPGQDGQHGIGRMMDIFDRHGARCTFFVDVYEVPLHGENEMAKVCRTIHDRGHDVQLHTHPAPMFAAPSMQAADLKTQTEILNRGCELIARWTSRRAVAHRAGGYLANTETVQACKQAAIPLDFSYNLAWPDSQLGQSGLTMNAPLVVDEVLCVPVTSYVQAKVGGWESMRFLDIEASSPQEIRKVVAELESGGVRTAVIMMHSFSFVRGGVANIGAEDVLDKLLADFVADSDVKLVTAAELYHIYKGAPERLLGSDFLPTTGFRMTYFRAWQRLDEGWKNVAVAFAPPLVALVMVAAFVLWLRRRKRIAAA